MLDWLASDFVKSGYDLKHLIGTIASSRTYQMPAVAREGDPPARGYVFAGPEVRRITAEQFADAIGSITGEWPAYLPGAGLRGPGAGQGDETSKRGVFARDWKVAASPLTRALGRPIRDQVYSTRETLATTLQGLELVNGETLTRRLSRGAKKMLGELPPEPVSLFDQPSARTHSSAGFFRRRYFEGPQALAAGRRPGLLFAREGRGCLGEGGARWPRWRHAAFFARTRGRHRYSRWRGPGRDSPKPAAAECA